MRRRQYADAHFQVVHRHRRATRLLHAVLFTGVISAAVGGAWALPTLFPTPISVVAEAPSRAETITLGPAGESTPETIDATPLAELLTGPATAEAPTPAQAPLDPAGFGPPTSDPAASDPVSPPARTDPWALPETQTALTDTLHYIQIDTRGYQAEIDQCLWVRMDLVGSSAPIVGAHNVCEGTLVLDLAVGDRVFLSGEGLDGGYFVAGSRDGYPGQAASEATAGMNAAVILQTCYWEPNLVRLVALVPLDPYAPALMAGSGA